MTIAIDCRNGPAGRRRAPIAPRGEADPLWARASARLLEAVEPALRPAVATLLGRPSHGGLGLRQWLRALVARAADLPASLPSALIRIYLEDPEAVPLHECEDCGLAVPVRPCREYGREWDPECAYFDRCPCCGGRTGLYVFRRGGAAPAPPS